MEEFPNLKKTQPLFHSPKEAFLEMLRILKEQIQFKKIIYWTPTKQLDSSKTSEKARF